MKFDLDGEAQSQGHENHFTLSDITPKGTIPYVSITVGWGYTGKVTDDEGSISFIRELANGVVTDVPLFMSHHRERMIESVSWSLQLC